MNTAVDAQEAAGVASDGFRGSSPYTLICADVRAGLASLPAESVDVTLTSVPYYRLRRYLGDDDPNRHLEIGQEPTVEAYIETLAEVFAEVRRALKPTGLAWINIADSYRPDGGLYLVPQRLALALQADGWLIRSVVIWDKSGNAMPESVGGTRWERCRVKVGREPADWKKLPKGWDAGLGAHDAIPHGNYRQAETREATTAVYEPCPGCKRCTPHDGYVLRRGSGRPTRAHEVLLMCAKGPGYYFNSAAVAEELTEWPRQALQGKWRRKTRNPCPDRNDGYGNDGAGALYAAKVNPAGRNPRDVWKDRTGPEPMPDILAINTVGSAAEHYAAFSVELCRRPVLAGPALCCGACGSPYAPVVERNVTGTRKTCPKDWHPDRKDHPDSGSRLHSQYFDVQTAVLGLRPTCACPGNPPPVPGVVLDPFCGTCTTGVAALRHGRRFIGIDVSERYLEEIARPRLEAEVGLFHTGSPEPEPAGESPVAQAELDL